MGRIDLRLSAPRATFANTYSGICQRDPKWSIASDEEGGYYGQSGDEEILLTKGASLSYSPSKPAKGQIGGSPLAPPDEYSRDSPDKPSQQKRVHSILTKLSLASSLAGQVLQDFGNPELAQILQLVAIALRSALLSGWLLRR